LPWRFLSSRNMMPLLGLVTGSLSSSPLPVSLVEALQVAGEFQNGNRLNGDLDYSAN